MKKLALCVLCFCVIWCVVCCDTRHSHDEQTFMVMSWNVQNLMDAHLDGTEYHEYKPSSGWDEDGYRTRLKAVARVVTAANPHLVVFQEIEHAKVLEDLLKTHLLREGYAWYGATTQPDSAIQVGFISRIPVDSVTVHRIGNNRPVLEIVCMSEHGKLVIIGVHGKSRKEGIAETEPERIELSSLIKRLAQAHGNETIVLAAGDFNGDAQSHLLGKFQTALVPSHHPRAALYEQQGSLLISGTHENGVWYNPWMDLSIAPAREGSYWYGGLWYQYDQILGLGPLFDGIGWEMDSFGVVTDALCNADGTPQAWNIRLRTGVSDHLPVWLRLKVH